MKRPAPYVAVVGGSNPTASDRRSAEASGALLARRGAVVLTGGRGGVMEAASRGAQRAGGITVGILPGRTREGANEYLTVALPTGMGELRNGLIVRAADALIAVGGSYGTLSEIALALREDVPVVGLGTWAIDGVQAVETVEQAVDRALAGADGSRAGA